MFCTKCGNQIPEGSRFCPKCGQETGAKSQVSQNQPFAGGKASSPGGQEIQESKKERKGRKRALIALLVVLLLALAAGGAFLGKKAIAQRQYAEQLALGDRYMEDLEYEAAVEAYNAAIEIEPNREDAYLGLAEAWLALGKPEEALNALQDGYERTGSDTILERLQELQEEQKNSQADDKAADGENGQQDITQQQNSVPQADQEPVDILVRQVDNSKFPEITFYASVTQADGETVKNLTKEDFMIREIDGQGNVKDASLSDVYQVMGADRVSMNLVLDSSGSMDSSNKIGQAKNAAISFVEKVNLQRGDAIEIIKFDDFVYLEQEFTSDYDMLHDAINNITLGGRTALLDGIYAGLMQTYYESGAKCVIAFTDGEENASSYTFDDVVNMAKTTGIPVFIIGIGSYYNYSELEELAKQCSGNYYSASESELETILEDIYMQIYQEQQDYYVFKYTSPDTSTTPRSISLETSENAQIFGNYQKEYAPVADLSGDFSDAYANLDYMITDSSGRKVTEQDLQGMSLAQLRIARNEIFARHGRQFRDVMLNKWFYSKTWYLNIVTKYSPDDFDAISPSPLSRLEIENVEFIKAYEDQLTATQDIFPDAANTLLSDYDLCLSKDVLKRALTQLQGYRNTAVLEENKQLIQNAIDQDEVVY